MCGRFMQATPEDIATHYGVDTMFDPVNVSPGLMLRAGMRANVVVENNQGNRFLASMRFGFDRMDGMPGYIYNARSETVSQRVSWMGPYQANRCIVPVVGFMEGSRFWQPRFQSGQMEMFALAGIFEYEPYRFAILTRQAGPEVMPYHDRVPIVIPEGIVKPWLDRGLLDPSQLDDLISSQQPSFLTV